MEELAQAPQGVDDQTLPNANPSPAPSDPEAQQPATEPAPEQQDQDAKDDEQKPSRYQARFSELVNRRKEAEAKAEMLEQQVAQLQQQLSTVPEGFHDWPWEDQQAYQINRAVKYDRLEQQQEALAYERQARQMARNNEFAQRVATKAGSLPDFDAAMSTFASMPCTEEMAEEIADSDRGVEIAYYLGKNPAEMNRILSLPLNKQAAAIARLERRVEPPTGARKLTAAPPPITPIGAGLPGAVQKDPQNMSEAEYFAWRSAQDKARAGG